MMYLIVLEDVDLSGLCSIPIVQKLVVCLFFHLPFHRYRISGKFKVHFFRITIYRTQYCTLINIRFSQKISIIFYQPRSLVDNFHQPLPPYHFHGNSWTSSSSFSLFSSLSPSRSSTTLCSFSCSSNACTLHEPRYTQNKHGRCHKSIHNIRPV